jgi:hypothetical protein
MAERSGSFPPAAATESFEAMLPEGFDRASITQREGLFARDYAKRMSIYVASDKLVPATVANAFHAFFEPLDIDALIILDDRAAIGSEQSTAVNVDR